MQKHFVDRVKKMVMYVYKDEARKVKLIARFSTFTDFRNLVFDPTLLLPELPRETFSGDHKHPVLSDNLLQNSGLPLQPSRGIWLYSLKLPDNRSTRAILKLYKVLNNCLLSNPKYVIYKAYI